MSNAVQTKIQVKIRRRERYQAGAPAGLSCDWIEWQVCHGRKIIHRAGSKTAAQNWCRDNGKELDQQANQE